MSFITSRDSSHSTLYRSCYHLHLIALPSNPQEARGRAALASLPRSTHAIHFQAIANSQMALPSLCLHFLLSVVICRSPDGLHLIGRWFICALTPLSVVEIATHLEFNETAGCISQSFTSSLSRHVICIICSSGVAIH